MSELPRESAIDLDALVGGMSDQIGTLQLALRVAYELAVRGPGTAAQIAERLQEHDDDEVFVSVEHVDEALAEMDPFALLVYGGLDDGDPIGLVGRS